jgi:Fe-S cluster assembly protein SufD
MASQPLEQGMTGTLEIASEVRAWTSNFEMLKSFSQQWPAQVAALREEAILEFERLGFPTTKNEEWKYTSLRNLVSGGYAPAFRPVAIEIADKAALYKKVLPAGLQGSVIVLVNGHFDAQLSHLPTDGIEVQRLKVATESGNPDVLKHLGRVAGFEGRSLVALNTAIALDGVFIKIPRRHSASEPVIVLHLGQGDGVVAHGRTLIVAEDLSEAKVVEVWQNWDTGPVWENHVSEILVGEGAKLELYTLQNRLGSNYALTHFAQVLQGKDSMFRSTVMSAEGQVVRNDLQVRHQGTGCTSYLNGLTLLDGTTHVDHHTLVDHAMPHCFSNETYRTVLDGSSTCVFNGKVIVRPDAQKTNAFQSNKTLLLSPGATVNSKPQLEIFADDVKCSHGATTGQLDETALFYMRSRGLSAQKARALLTYAFGAAVLEQISIPAVRDTLEHYLMERLGGA